MFSPVEMLLEWIMQQHENKGNEKKHLMRAKISRETCDVAFFTRQVIYSMGILVEGHNAGGKIYTCLHNKCPMPNIE